MNRDIIIKNFDVLVLGIHTLLFLLYISPFSYLKSIQGLLLGGGMYLISGLMIGFIVFRLIKKRVSRAILLIIISIALVFFDLKAYEIRQTVLDKTINWLYCPTDNLEYGDRILGGVFFVNGKAGFENTTHCLMVVCHEEFYNCNDK